MMQSTKSLDVTIDKKLTLVKHVNNVCSAAHYHVRTLRHLCKFVSKDTINSVASSVVVTGRDYCSSVLYGATRSNIDKLINCMGSCS
jgi:hypothetical protein